MKDEDKFQFMVLKSLLKEYELEQFVCLFDVAEETVCLEVFRDDSFLVSDYEKGSRRRTQIYTSAYDVILDIIDRVTDSVDLEVEIRTRFKELVGKEMEKGR